MRPKLNKDPVAWATHFAGLVGAIVGLVLLVVHTAHDAAKVTSMALYGGSLVALFAASVTYHFLDLGERGNRWLRRVDHAAIYLLIAGSYVPASMHLLDGGWRVSILSVVGGLALFGILFKVVWIDAPAWLSTLLYVALGWLAVIPAYRIFPQLDAPTLALLLAGGLAYTVGAVVYLKRWPDPWPRLFGHHEIWHLFVLAGATAHFGFNWGLVGQRVPPF
jgi:hemolysin III